MSAEPSNPTPQGAAPPVPRRWRHSRKLRYVAVLLGICVAGYFVLPWLLMPGDLRLMQGTWNVVRVTSDGKEEESKAGASFLFVGSRLNISDETGKGVETHALGCHSDAKELRVFVEDEITIFGTTMRAPIWLKPAKESIAIKYELGDARLRLHIELGGTKREIFLERK